MIPFSRLTLGTAQLGLNYGVNNKVGKPTSLSGETILQSSYDLGIRSFDTASQYGDSESVIGDWVKKNNPINIQITSKLHSLQSQQVLKSTLEKVIRDSVQSSLSRLNISCLDNYLLHDFRDLLCYGDLLVKIITRLKNEGLIQNWGCSIYDVEEAGPVIDHHMDLVQVPFNIWDRRFFETGLLSRFQKEKIAVFSRSVFLQGLFFMSLQKLPEKLMDAKSDLETLISYSQEKGLSIGAICAGFVNSFSDINSILIGVETEAQLMESTKWFGQDPIDPGEIVSLFNNIQPHIRDPRQWTV